MLINRQTERVTVTETMEKDKRHNKGDKQRQRRSRGGVAEQQQFVCVASSESSAA